MKPIHTIATCRTPERVHLALIQHDRDYFLMLGGEQLMSTNACASEQQMADLACAGLPADGRVLIGGLGFGFTLRRVLDLAPPGAAVKVAELLPQIIEWNRKFLGSVNGKLIDEPRVQVQLKDVFDMMDPQKIEKEGGYHAILLDVDNSPDPLVQRGNARLYARMGLNRVKAALQPKGRVVFWSANRDEGFAKALRGTFARVQCVPARAYPKAKYYSHTLFVADRD